MLDANGALVQANKTSQGRLIQVVDEEKQKSAEERQQLLAQITSLINSTAEAQDKRMNEKVSSVCKEIGVANAAFETKQGTYNDGINAWSDRSTEILAGISKSRDGVKSRIKSDFAVSTSLPDSAGYALMIAIQAATQHSTSIKNTTTSVHATTVNIVEAQMEQMDMQLRSLDDIMSRVRAQNDAHHTAHTSSLSALSSTVQSSYSSIGDHLSTSFARVQSLESDVSAQTTALKETLPALAEDASIRAPLHELREAIGSQNLIEYNPTGETPQRVAYTIPEKLPRTEAHEAVLPRFRDRPASSDATRSPSKGLVFNDATQTTSTLDDFFSSTIGKPNFSRSMSAHATSTIPLGASLRELDVNVVSQENHTQPLPIVSRSDTMVMAGPPLKKQRGEDGSKLPMKKMGRKTVGGEGKADRENLTITSFSSSIGPGVSGGRKLRSHGSN